jgi:hypothetical protein
LEWNETEKKIILRYGEPKTKPVTPLDKLTACFDELGIHYVRQQTDSGYTNIYISNEEEQKANKSEERHFGSRQLFEFDPNGDVASF